MEAIDNENKVYDILPTCSAQKSHLKQGSKPK